MFALLSRILNASKTHSLTLYRTSSLVQSKNRTIYQPVLQNVWLSTSFKKGSNPVSRVGLKTPKMGVNPRLKSNTNITTITDNSKNSWLLHRYIRWFIRVWRIRMIKERVVSFRLLAISPVISIPFSISCLCGHISFVLLGVSYLFSDIWSLRSVAIAAGTSMLAFNFFHPNGKPLWLPFRWNLLFILTNILHLLWMLHEENDAKQMGDQFLQAYTQVFQPTGLSLIDFRSLVRAGSIVYPKVNNNLCYEGADNHQVMFIIEGRADVTIRGEHVYELTAGQFIGEMGIHVGLHVMEAMKATATVTAVTPMKIISWSRVTLIELLKGKPHISQSIQSAISADLLRKLSRDNLDTSAMHVKGIRQYSRLLESVLSGGVVSKHDKNMLRRYRILHRIVDADHDCVLNKLKWTHQDYELGSKISKTSDSSDDEMMEHYACAEDSRQQPF